MLTRKPSNRRDVYLGRQGGHTSKTVLNPMPVVPLAKEVTKAIRDAQVTGEEVSEVVLTARMVMRMPAAHSTASLIVSIDFSGYLMLSSSQ